MTKTDSLNVRIFKLLEWVLRPPKCDPTSESKMWVAPNDGPIYRELPLIHENAQLMIDWLVPAMRERGYQYSISQSGDFWWRRGRIFVKWVEITNDNIALAACEAALPILEKLWEEKHEHME